MKNQNGDENHGNWSRNPNETINDFNIVTFKSNKLIVET